MSDQCIRIKGLSKSFNNIPILKKIDVTIKPGKVYSVIGKNGAGKSTLVKILAGVHQADTGEISYNGSKVSLKSPKDALKLGWSFVYQDLELFENLSIAENIFFNNFPETHAGYVNKNKMYSMADELSEEIGFRIDCKTKVSELSMGEKKLVAFMRVLARKADVVVIDEITSGLTDEDAKHIFKIIKELKNKGKYIILVTHNLSEVFEHVDRVIVLRDGEVVATGIPSEIKDNVLIKSMVGKDVRKRYPKLNVKIGREILRVDKLSVPGVLKDISFSLNRSEVLGITGLIGSGRTTLAKSIFGINTNYTGDLYINRRKVKTFNPRTAVKAGIGLIPDDRLNEGIFSVSDLKLNITIAHLQAIERHKIRWLIDKRAEKAISSKYLEKLGVNYFSLNQQMRFLSSGNQQKVLVARWFLANSEVLILDEPTKELDIASKVEVYNLINEMVRQNKAVILISSDFSEIIGMCDKILVLSCGKVVLSTDKYSVSKDSILEAALAEELKKANNLGR